jgi:predicted dehydrogenase
MKDGKYGVLVHGAGWVSGQHIAAFAHNPHTEIAAISSRKLASARARADEAGLKHVAVYDDYQEALQHEGVDIVSICTPQHLHCENVLAAAAAGKHMVIEKPVGNSVAELRQMREAVRKAGVRTIVSFVLRWNPLFRTIKAMIADDTVGRVYFVETDYEHDVASWWTGFEDVRKSSTGVSAFLAGGCHAVDSMRWFAGRGEFEAARPAEVFAYSGGWRKGVPREFNYLSNTFRDSAPLEYDGLEVALVKFSNGALGKVSVNFDCVMPYTFPIEIFGDKGTIRDNRIWSHKFPGQKDWVTLPAILPDSAEVSHHPFQAQMDHFVDCLRSGRESHCNLEDAILTHEVVFAALECYRTNCPVKLPLLAP